MSGTRRRPRSAMDKTYTREEIKEISERLYSKHTTASRLHLRPTSADMRPPPRQPSRPHTATSTLTTQSDIENIVKRLSQVKKEVPDSKRVGSAQKYGVVNSYAWRGWNTDVPHIFWRYNYPRNWFRSAL
eukprot:sb/3475177/